MLEMGQAASPQRSIRLGSCQEIYQHSSAETLRLWSTRPRPHLSHMERVYDIELKDIGKECRRPASGQRPHISHGKCETCADVANKNADNFITNFVLAQLQQLTSYETGLNGFILPPPRITETVPMETWQPITSAREPFRLIRGGIARHDIMVSPKTLKVTCIFDWEHAGYFPPELEAAAWRMTHSEYRRLFDARERIQEELELIGG